MADSQKYAETINVMPSAPAETKTQSNCTVVCDGQGRYTVTGINSTSEPIVFEFVLNEPFTIPKSVGNGGQGTMSLFNDVSANVNCSFYNGNLYIDGWMLSPVNRTHNSYTAQSDKVCDRLQIRIHENSSANVTFSPMFTNDGQYPSEFVPHQTWKHSLRKLTTATEAVENPLYADGTAITTYTLKGNEEHTGTPSPSNPVMPQGVGEMSSNMINYQLLFSNNPVKETENFRYYRLSVKPNTQYTLKSNAPSTITPSAQTTFLYGDSDTMTTVNNGVYTDIANTATSTADGYIFVAIRKFYQYITEPTETDFANGTYTIMINEGSTALPYEPYGQYKIPISTLQGSAVNYLGSVSSNRQIYKYEFTGQEEWARPSSNIFRVGISGYLRQSDYTPICTHYKGQSAVSATSELEDYSCAFLVSSSGNNYYYIRDLNYDAYTDFKAYLAAQYAAGTPVTVWYVLATEETGIVNEPLMKIGDYADTLSNATAIPTTEGANTITVDTTVQPSEFLATWSGWHNAYVKEKSENLANENDLDLQKWISSSGNISDNPQGTIFKEKIAITTTNYTVKATANQGAAAGIGVAIYNSNDEFIRREYSTSLDKTLTFATTTGDNYFKIIVATANTSTESIIQSLSIMANEGSTSQTYAPYWK